MKSISWKILKTTLCWIIISISLITAISIAAITDISKKDSVMLLDQVCEKESLRFNNEFKYLENSVSIVAKYINDLENECISKEEMLSEDFSSKILDMTLSIANRTYGAMAVYFRYNPELTGNGTEGFFYSRDNSEEEFIRFEPTDILQYDQHDVEHVGWFYEPKKARKAMWMSPYYNKNLDIFMISYVIPYYTNDGEFLGVVGMDINYYEILKLTNEVSLYESGKINLIDLSNYMIYGMNKNDETETNALSAKLYNHLTTINKENETLKLIDENGDVLITSVSRLENGMRLMLSVYESEINAQRNRMLTSFAVSTFTMISVAVFFMARMTNRMVNPLKRLTVITKKYADGDWSETYISDTSDEIQVLSESISTMAETTKSYIETIRESSNTDALTGLKNKNCYLSYIEELENNKTDEEYAVAVLDINFLKKINDLYGHEAGDLLIKKAGEYICGIFVHSPVFRIGGDEFCIILKNHDYLNRDALHNKFIEDLKKMPAVVDGNYLSISIGIALRPEDGFNYEEVFKVADDRMYEYKKAMKANR